MDTTNETPEPHDAPEPPRTPGILWRGLPAGPARTPGLLWRDLPAGPAAPSRYVRENAALLRDGAYCALRGAARAYIAKHGDRIGHSGTVAGSPEARSLVKSMWDAARFMATARPDEPQAARDAIALARDAERAAFGPAIAIKDTSLAWFMED